MQHELSSLFKTDSIYHERSKETLAHKYCKTFVVLFCGILQKIIWQNFLYLALACALKIRFIRFTDVRHQSGKNEEDLPATMNDRRSMKNE